MRRKLGSSFAILFVDDEAKTRKMFKKLVAPYYEVLLAEDVPSAIAVLESESDKIGVLLTDQRMPGQLGADLLRHTRKKYPTLIRMLTTAYSDLDDAIDAVNTGEIYRYIHKPWNIDELLIDLKLAINLFELQRSRQQLIEEKLSISTKRTRLKLIQQVISIASNQRPTTLSVQGVITGLKKLGVELQTADSLLYREAMESYWDAEVAHTQNLIEVGHLVDKLCNHSVTSRRMQTVTFNELSVDIRTVEGSVSIKSILTAIELQGLVQAVMSLFSKDPSASTGSFVDRGGRQVLTIKTSQPNSLLLEVFSSGILVSTLRAELVANMIGVFILAEVAGAQVDFGFDQDKLHSVSLSFPSEAIVVTEGDDLMEVWIEDLFVLFSSF